MPARCALAAIALGLPPLDLLAYQIHIPSPSKGLGEGTNWGVAIGGATVTGCACAGPAVRASATRPRAMRRATVTMGTTNRAQPCSLRLNGSAVVPPCESGGPENVSCRL